MCQLPVVAFIVSTFQIAFFFFILVLGHKAAAIFLALLPVWSSAGRCAHLLSYISVFFLSYRRDERCTWEANALVHRKALVLSYLGIQS